MKFFTKIADLLRNRGIGVVVGDALKGVMETPETPLKGRIIEWTWQRVDLAKGAIDYYHVVVESDQKVHSGLLFTCSLGEAAPRKWEEVYFLSRKKIAYRNT